MEKLIQIIFIVIALQVQSFAVNTISNQGKKSGSITGHVIDNETGENVEYASVSLLNNKTKEIVTGVLTNQKGLFNFDKINPGKYFIKIDFIGYKTHTSNEIFINKDNKNFDLGTIHLRADIDLLICLSVSFPFFSLT